MAKTSTEYSRIWRAKNRERAREISRAWLERNPEKAKAYREKNKARRHAQTSKWKKENPDKVAIVERRSLLKKKYGLSLEQYEAMSEAQGHSCAICGGHREQEHTGKLIVDHCHATGAVRGLLCNTCNRGIGLLKDDPQLLSHALNYLLTGKREAA
jgi:hypothetical protein